MPSGNTEIHGILIKTTLLDFPGRVACTFFLPGCNLKCPYCYNRELAEGILPAQNRFSVTELYAHLQKRKDVLSGLVLTGGEALLNPHISDIISTAKSFGYKIKLDTNGTLPEKLEQLVSNKNTKPDFIAMDIKTSPQKYEEKLTFPQKNSSNKKNEIEKSTITEKILRSIKIISEYPPESREFRTVLVPKLIQKEDIEEISKIIPQDSSWQFAQFINENCLDPEFQKIPPFSQIQAEEFIKIAQRKIPNANLR